MELKMFDSRIIYAQRWRTKRKVKKYKNIKIWKNDIE